MRAQLSFVLSQITLLTERRTDRILIARPRLHSMQRGKKWDCRRCTENYGRSNEVTRHTTSHVSLQFEFKQVAQLSQRDRAAGCVSFGKKCKTGTGGQYSTEIISLFSITVTSSACTAIDFGEKLQNTGGYGVQDHSRSSRSVPIKSLRLPISDQ